MDTRRIRRAALIFGAWLAITGSSLALWTGLQGEEVIVQNGDPGQERLPIEVPAGGIVGPARWPDACALVGDADIRAILPQATNIRRTAEWVRLTPSAAFGGRAGAGTATNGRCKYDFDLPGNGARKDERGTGGFAVKILAVGDPVPLSDHFELSKSARHEWAVVTELNATEFGADECYANETGKNELPRIVCRRGPFMFEQLFVSFDNVSFEDGAEDSPGYDEVVRRRVVPALIRAVTARIGRTPHSDNA